MRIKLSIKSTAALDIHFYRPEFFVENACSRMKSREGKEVMGITALLLISVDTFLLLTHYDISVPNMHHLYDKIL